MGRGRKPKPASAKSLDGDASTAGSSAGAAPSAEAPPRPGWLTDEARAEWDYIVPPLVAAGIITRLDQAILSLFCEALARFRHANAAVETTGGEVVETAGRQKIPNPWRTVANKAADQVHKFGSELGLTPAARSRVMQGGPKGGAPTSQLEGFLGIVG